MEYNTTHDISHICSSFFTPISQLLQQEGVLIASEFSHTGSGNRPLIDNKKAERHCRDLMNILENSKRLDYSKTSAVTFFSTTGLFGEARGQMFGILVCAPVHTGEPDIILKAFSGQYNGEWTVSGWAPPIIDPQTFRRAVAIADPPIKKLSALIKSLPAGERRSALIEKRRLLSQRHMREIHGMYTIRNFAGGSTDLFSLFKNKPGIPAGTGDCCAPKLLNRAVLLGLKPISMAEFYWGRENRSNSKQHGRFYPPCAEKCMPILPYMLKGTEWSMTENA